MLFRGDDGAWAFLAFVPDNASVKDKMLYSSGRANLIKALGGPDYFKTLCVNATKPRLCSYRLKLKHGESASHRMCLRMAEELRAHEFAERQHSEGMVHLRRILSNGGVSG